jgi:hypothetical protein
VNFFPAQLFRLQVQDEDECDGAIRFPVARARVRVPKHSTLQQPSRHTTRKNFHKRECSSYVVMEVARPASAARLHLRPQASPTYLAPSVGSANKIAMVQQRALNEGVMPSL